MSDYRFAFAISAAGMQVEQLRLETIATNIAHMHTSSPTAQGRFEPRQVVSAPAQASFAQWLDFDGAQAMQALPMPVAQVVATPSEPRLVHDPAHPHADTQGMVAYPGVDHSAEMVRMLAALRAYEANVAAANAARAMATRALDIGGQR